MRLPADLHGKVKSVAAGQVKSVESAYQNALERWLEGASTSAEALSSKTDSVSDQKRDSILTGPDGDWHRKLAHIFEGKDEEAIAAVKGLIATLSRHQTEAAKRRTTR